MMRVRVDIQAVRVGVRKRVRVDIQGVREAPPLALNLPSSQVL